MTSDRCESCGFSADNYSPDPTILAVGSMLQNRYRIGGIIGKGGFGITYIAFDTKLERRIAVKEFFPFGLAIRSTQNTSVMTTGDADVFRKGAEKFYDEARLIARFNSTGNIVNVHDVFYENDTVYYAMEYLRGQTLKSYVENSGKLTPGQAVCVAKEISEALSISHQMNVLHRDISPDNIMLCSDGKVKLIDFGAARQVVSEGSQSMSVILTQGFAPLEQYQKKGKQGPWTDIYSLGASLYYGMTGDILDDPMSRFEDDSEFQSNTHAIDSELWKIITKAVMIKIADRYQSAAEFEEALAALSVRPEKIVISDEAARIKVSSGITAHSGISQSQPTDNSMSGASSMETMPVSQSSQMQTMPVSQSSQMRTMPVNEAQHPKTGNYENNDTPKKKNRIPVIAGAASGLILLIAIIAIAVNGGSSDDIAIEESETATTSVSESEKITEKEPETEKEEEIIVQPDNSEKASQEPSQKPAENAAQPEKPEKTPQEPSTKPAETTAKETPSLPQTKWQQYTYKTLDLSYKIPDSYKKQSSSTNTRLSYADSDSNSKFILSFDTECPFPICSYKEMPELIDYYLESNVTDKITGGSGSFIDFAGRSAWKYEYTVEKGGKSYNCMYIFCDSKTKYGCYAFYADHIINDEKSMKSCDEFINSISITGTRDSLLDGKTELYRDDLGISIYDVSADVAFFYPYSLQDNTFYGGNNSALMIFKNNSNGGEYIELYVNNMSMADYCDGAKLDKNNIQKKTYGRNTFEYIKKDSEHYMYTMKTKGKYLHIKVTTDDEELNRALKNHILPSIYVYD